MARTRTSAGGLQQIIEEQRAQLDEQGEQIRVLIAEGQQRQAALDELIARNGTAPIVDATPQDQTIEEWIGHLQELDPEGGAGVRVFWAPTDQGRHRAQIGYLTDPKAEIAPLVEKIAQLKGIEGHQRFVLTPVRNGRYIEGMSQYELWLVIEPKPAAAPNPTLDPSAILTGTLSAADKIIEAGKRLTPPATAPTSSGAEDAAKMTAAILDVGTKMAAMSSGGTKELIGLLTPLVTQIANRMFTPSADPRDKIVDLIIKRELEGNGRRGGDEDEPMGPMAELQADLMRAAIETVRGGGRDRPTVGVELVRLGVPLLPRVVDRITETVRDGFAFARERMYWYANPPGRRPARATTQPRPGQPPAEASTAMPPPDTAAAALVAVLQHASPWAQAGDESKFPELAGMLTAQVPGCAALLEDLRAGRASDQTALDSIAAMGIDIIEPLAGYVRRFLAWARTAPAGPAASAAASPVEAHEAAGAKTAPAGAAVVDPDAEPCDTVVNGQPCGGAIKAISRDVGRCEKCGAEYTYRG